MTEHDRVTRLLGTDGEDAGCEGTLALLAEYVEGLLRGRPVDQLFPAVATHLRNCPACAEDCERVLALVRGERAG
jgi:hypothetical protein